MGGTPSCPIEFDFTPSGTSCVVRCPESEGYYLKSSGQVLSCSYRTDPTIQFALTTAPIYMAGGQESPDHPVLMANDGYRKLPDALKQAYQKAIDDFNTKKAVADAGIANDVKVSNAFAALQAAEDARGTPAGETAYENARVAYYTLTKGEGWAETEKERIAQTQAQPIIDGLVSQYRNLQAKQAEQASTIQVINGLQDKVLTVKDDLAFSVRTFQKQVDNIKNQINIDKKNQADATKATVSWIEVVLNWMIAIATLVCIFLLLRYFSRPLMVQRKPDGIAKFFDLFEPRQPPPPRV